MDLEQLLIQMMQQQAETLQVVAQNSSALRESITALRDGGVEASARQSETETRLSEMLLANRKQISDLNVSLTKFCAEDTERHKGMIKFLLLIILILAAGVVVVSSDVATLDKLAAIIKHWL